MASLLVICAGSSRKPARSWPGGLQVVHFDLGGVDQHGRHLRHGAGAIRLHRVLAVAQVGQGGQQVLAQLVDVRCGHACCSCASRADSVDLARDRALELHQPRQLGRAVARVVAAGVLGAGDALQPVGGDFLQHGRFLARA
jgi:hypothetical protein